MNFTFDSTPINDFFNLPADQMLLAIFINFGWIPIAIVFIWGSWLIWVYYRQILFSKTIKSVLLAIDIPRNNEVAMRSIENLFTYLGGAHEPTDLIEKYWLGMYQLGFSFEIISIEGYIQFLVKTPDIYRDIVESAIYSVYPDAEITEVNDYTEGFPTKFPDEEYDVWGGEFILTKKDSYPIRVHRDFEQLVGKPETVFKDPMAALMDLYSSFKKGEHMWLQLIVYPTGFEWPQRGEQEISKIIGEKVAAKSTLLNILFDLPVKLLQEINVIIFGDIAAEKAKEEKLEFKMMNLKPVQKKQIEAIQNKMGKLGFECKLRFAYVAKKEVKNRPKAIGGLIGFIKQFTDLDLNGLKPDMEVTATTAHYFFTEYRKNIRKMKIMSAYKDRTGTRGRKRFILNTEELATLWHFPIEAVVRAPLIQKAPGRKAEPPMALPLEMARAEAGLEKELGEENIFILPEEKDTGQTAPAAARPKEELREEDIFKAKATESKDKIPENLPFVDN